MEKLLVKHGGVVLALKRLRCLVMRSKLIDFGGKLKDMKDMIKGQEIIQKVR